MQILLNHLFGSHEASPFFVAGFFRFFATRIIHITVIYVIFRPFKGPR